MYPYRQFRYSYGPYRSPTLAPEPDVDLLARQLDEDMMNMRTELERRMQQQLHQVPHALPPLDMGIRRSPSFNRYSLSTVNHSPPLAKPSVEKYELTMDVSPFTPEELTVKTEGRQLIVTGKRDKKTETENGGCHHEFRDFRREFELPEGVNPEDVQCSLSDDGQLFIQNQSPELPPAQERLVPINVGQVSGGRL
ncbi:heat shock protein 30C-like [Hyla sarda]|uniref:heat shock protein 30C-like n=1 Tax=Hyla sarda TaxID=327740 RepID=UPI0024C4137D|nr:heat shock protein 30C-like [Hyla sarda]